MRKIEIDSDIYTYLQSKAIAFEETPNMTLRRLLGLRNNNFLDVTKSQTPQSYILKKKQPKTNLLLLIKSGVLHEGQKLFLYNYRGEKVHGYDAVISGKSLLWKDSPYSMSELAKIGLQENNYTSNFVQGPARWFNGDGVSVVKLWSDYLQNKDNNK